MGGCSVLMALLSHHPPLAFHSHWAETWAELYSGSLEPLPVEQKVCLWQWWQGMEAGFPLDYGGLNFALTILLVSLAVMEQDRAETAG